MNIITSIIISTEDTELGTLMNMEVKDTIKATISRIKEDTISMAIISRTTGGRMVMRELIDYSNSTLFLSE